MGFSKFVSSEENDISAIIIVWFMISYYLFVNNITLQIGGGLPSHTCISMAKSR